MAVQISFCGYNGNTTVRTIREDFKKLETVKNKVKEYRSKGGKGGKGKFDAIMALIMNEDGHTPNEIFQKNFLKAV